jgi:hypothetical protein
VESSVSGARENAKVFLVELALALLGPVFLLFLRQLLGWRVVVLHGACGVESARLI